jgi:hypothetical protein
VARNLTDKYGNWYGTRSLYASLAARLLRGDLLAVVAEAGNMLRHDSSTWKRICEVV